MVVFPNTKINLGLYVVDKRPDGFHNIETCFYPVEWCDMVEIIESPKTTFNSTGIDIPGNPEENLCLKAYQLLQSVYNLPTVSIHLHKNIPIGAGLGGGSSDAAFILKAVNEKFNLSLSNDDLKKYASKLGSDCSFFIDNVPSMAYEKGDVLEAINFSLKDKYLILIYPGIHVDTKTAYSGIVPRLPKNHINDIILTKPLKEWRDILENDFEKGIFLHFPEIGNIKNQLYELGAKYASMSGSGSTVFGIFEKAIDITNVFPPNYTIWSQYI